MKPWPLVAWAQACRRGQDARRARLVARFDHDNLYRKQFLPALAVRHIPSVRWHDLRHFYASECAGAGLPIERVAKFMGHADIATIYKHYLHLFNDDLADDMDHLAALASRPALARIG